jgi:hypothetical protein
VVPKASTADGVNVAVVPLYATVPATAVPPGPVTVKVEAVIEAGLIAMLKVAATVELTATPVEP